MIPIQLSHERRQVFRHRGASGIGEFGPQSGCKRLQELNWVEGDGGQTAHPYAPTDSPGPTVRSRALCREYDGGSFVPRRRQDFWKQWSETGVGGQTTNWAISKGAQTFLRLFPFAVPTRGKALVTTLSQRALATRALARRSGMALAATLEELGATTT